MIRLIALVIGAFLLGGHLAAQPLRMVVGRVIDSLYTPIYEAEIRYGSTVTLTNREGIFALVCDTLSENPVYIVKEGFLYQSRSVSDLLQQDTVAVMLHQYGALSFLNNRPILPDYSLEKPLHTSENPWWGMITFLGISGIRADYGNYRGILPDTAVDILNGGHPSLSYHLLAGRKRILFDLTFGFGGSTPKFEEENLSGTLDFVHFAPMMGYQVARWRGLSLGCYAQLWHNSARVRYSQQRFATIEDLMANPPIDLKFKFWSYGGGLQLTYALRNSKDETTPSGIYMALRLARHEIFPGSNRITTRTSTAISAPRTVTTDGLFFQLYFGVQINGHSNQYTRKYIELMPTSP